MLFYRLCFIIVLPFADKTFSVTMPMTAASAAVSISRTVTETVFAPLNQQHLAVYQGFRQLFTRFDINTLDRGAGDIHLTGALFLRESDKVDQSYRFILVNRHPHIILFIRPVVKRPKPVAFGK